MWSEERIIDYLRRNLKEKRFIHSIGVRDTAIKLAQCYDADINKAALAGLVHDAGKYMSGEDIIDILNINNIEVDFVTSKNPDIMHGIASAYIAENIMGICDNDVLDAVRYHTTGRENMTLLEKVIYLADYIEPSRNYKGVEKLRELSYKDLDTALVKAFDNTINYVIKNGWLLHLMTVKARNYLLSEINERSIRI
ncbi:putative nicotinate-nucleotide adenylyltransferase [Clostridium tepidiprofundi DSM 19306]|uniref:bis(5'-nucleosyl)-tetraphosphatase (symmetrical) n=1 Tax=Clostridium tepidiprofundi DSM 19306 TaxID=1121338 RepID=A0A151B3M4_9CLOT|nr:bis(5'-nucleosyl)-tetraphosphatase (symmetrical) YqeK [Clostridium tepidiprofundi]KYH34496.1 putative nicotinate-nucleotide adenylyltransferase [Clostridium tepidiprofundi DSM 19306]